MLMLVVEVEKKRDLVISDAGGSTQQLAVAGSKVLAP